jgi:uncharacterized membrane protein YfcA
MEILYIAIGNLIVFSGGLIQGTIGTGSSLFAVPLLVLFLSPKVVVPMMIIECLYVNSYISSKCRDHTNIKRILILLLAGFAGMIPGVRILAVLPPKYIKILMGVTIALVAAAYLAGFRRKMKDEKIASIPIGLVSGFLSGSISMSGPPIVLFFVNQEVDKGFFRGNLALYFLILNILTIPVFFLNGLITKDVLEWTLLLFPGIAAGTILGNKISANVTEKNIKKMALIIVLIAGISSLLSGIRG